MKISVVCAASPQVKMERVNVARCLGPVSVWIEHRQPLEPLEAATVGITTVSMLQIGKQALFIYLFLATLHHMEFPGQRSEPQS